MNYEQIAAAIHFLDDQRSTRPRLDLVASRVGLSGLVFHDTFGEWTGVRTSDVLQCLTLSHARELLHAGEAALAVAGNGGKPCGVELVVASDDEARGDGLTIKAGVADTPFGLAVIGNAARGLCHLAFFDPGAEAPMIAELRSAWPLAEIIRDDADAMKLAARIFDPSHGKPWTLLVRGTPFQLRVWQAMLHVPAGALVSYGQLAAVAGVPGGSRAVGSAVAANSIGFLIPCHRVVRSSGSCGEYRWGALRKRVILAWETSRAASPGSAWQQVG